MANERETAFYKEVLPSIEKLVKVYRYDGIQDPAAGAAILIVLAASKESHVTVRGSAHSKQEFKTVLAILAFLIIAIRAHL